MSITNKLADFMGIFLIIIACSFWAFDTLIRYPLINDGVSAINIVFYEHLILTVIFIVVFFKAIPNIANLKLKHVAYFIVVGGFGSALATLAFTRAFYFLNPSLVILLQKFQPVVAILLARIFLKESINKLFIIWAMVCLAGALMVSYHDILIVTDTFNSFSDLFNKNNASLGYLLVIISILGWGASTVFSKKLELEGFSNEQIMGGRFITGLVFLIPFAMNVPDTFTHSVEVYGKVSLMVLISGLLAMYVFYQGLRRTSARACSLAEMFFPFMAVIVNWLFLGATLSPMQIMGGALLLLGSVVIQLKHY